MNHPLSLNPVLRSAFLWTLCGIATFTAAAYSQSPSNLGHQFWSTDNGLPQNSSLQISQSRHAYLWTSTAATESHIRATSFKLFSHSPIAPVTTNDISP